VAKRAKREVQFEAPAQGPHHCGECEYFLSSQKACRLVEGAIDAGDWCKLFKIRSGTDMAKGKRVLAKLAKTKPTKGMKKPPAPAASLMQAMQGGAPQSMGAAFGP
jgi:hypothetical protein